MKKMMMMLLAVVLAILVFSLGACTTEGAGESTVDNDESATSVDPSEESYSPAVFPGRTPSRELDWEDGEITYETPVIAGVEAKPFKEKMYLDFVGDRTYGLVDYWEVESSGIGETGSEKNGYDEQSVAGQITASAWDDNQYYTEWKELFEKGNEQDEKEDGKFTEYVDNAWKFDTRHRVTVTVTKEEQLVAGADVLFYDEDQTALKAKTNAKGVAYLFPKAKTGTVVVTSGEGEANATFTEEERDVSAVLTESNEKANVIKLMYVVDVTGSMGDELQYLKVELVNVIHRVAASDTDARIDLALLFYRDDGDEEKFAYSDFKTVTDENELQTQLAVLKKQFATGGGDMPEAVDEALEMAVGEDWGEENSTKMIFFVLDAPPHSTKTNIDRCGKAVRKAAEKGIRICPILCSGADKLTEYVSRQGAIYTGGTFVYVTDDSGIGNAHYDPEIPNAVVERLNDLMVRLIKGYHSGVFGDPIPFDQV